MRRVDTRNRFTLLAAIACALLLVPGTAFADDHEGDGGDGAAGGDAPAAEDTDDGDAGDDTAADEAGDAAATDAAASESDAETATADADDEDGDDEDGEDGDEEDRVSEDGSYEWKFAWGAGFEFGLFVTALDRWNTHLLDPNGADEFDTSFMGTTDLAIEVYPIEGLRITAFGGVTAVYGGNPGLLAWYAGLEPAFAVRRGIWEIAAGAGIGGGKIELDLDAGDSASGTILMVRPFVEPRIYPTEWMAIYLRLGFNLFQVLDYESDTLALDPNNAVPSEADQLSEAGLYTALGFRFGSYPEHIKVVPDSDDDGLLDDVDDCPQEPEDKDGFEDNDGCPEADNDKDGILDNVDQCIDVPEDLDGWMDEDGCPETDDDTDGDGILNKDDACVDQPEDKDGFEDTDGCPDLDNDKDGVPDVEDDCPNEAGVPQNKGCPIRRVQVTLDAIVITEKVFFELDKSEIKAESFGLLDEVAQVIVDNPRIKKIEIGGHTDHQGKAKYNLKLSQGRADAVRDYLISKGVEAERLSAVGYGFDNPLVPLEKGKKETPEAAAKNRRVEFNILEQDEATKIMNEDEVPEGADTAPVEGGE